ncbi:type 1 glutamine amidotransferase [Roseivivax isoporae]|uniref:Glutamine amidotransferase n=1 Tax=Roseivivax isoporae LMG 25204 TaxID=1449351 RepID=X7FDB2_9RHOB|nr:type 1 glutamine amidotransferase [Roseivivax isoporae]ETX30051.1 glutamine amidotransferase [Roseivivax isoporae LMG 25204]
MKIGILQTGLLPDTLISAHGDYPDLYARLLDGHGFEFEAWRVVEGAFPDGPEAAEGWLITGSRHGAYEDHPWIPPLEALIRDIVAAERPLVGVCFGHQIIAQALGGRVEKFPAGWSVGPQVYDFPEGPLAVTAWHQDQVTAAPEGAEVVASSDFCANAALLYAGRAYSVQPHPEFTDAFTRDLIDSRGRGTVPDALLDAARARLGQSTGAAAVGDQLARFLKTRSLA